VKPTQTLKLAFIVALLFASHAYALRLGWVLRDAEVTVQQATVRALKQRVELLEVERGFWQRSARAAQKTILRSRQRIVEVSAYSASEAECDKDPHIAASTQPPRPGTVAVSRDLFNMGWTFGKRVYLKGLGPYIINDVMHQRYQMRVDVFMDHKRAAREFGVRTTEAILG
jgi:3D (Asp-Asp-Asp) domain-containing protein